MGKVNPYKLVGGIGTWTLIVLVGSLFAMMLVVFPIQMMWPLWGWWAILAAPIWWAVWAVFVTICWGIEEGGKAIARKWNDAAYNWERKN